MSTDVVLIPVEQLILDPKYQARLRLDVNHLERLRNTDPKTWPPLLVRPIAEQPGIYAVVDGGHRLEAGKKLASGRRVTALPCCVLEGAGYGASFNANASHPLTLSVKERLRYALLIHEKAPKASARSIAKQVGLAHNTVSKAFAGGGSSGGSADDSDEAVVRRVLGLMTKNPTAVHADEVYSSIFGGPHAAQVYKAVRHWVTVLDAALQRAEAQAAAD